MPKRKRQYKGKKQYNGKGKKRRLNKQQVTVIRGVSLLPDKMIMKMKFSEHSMVLTNAGTTGTQVYRGNSVWDPDFSGTGTSCQGLAEWSAFYKTYRVYASKINMNVCFLDQPISYGVIPSILSTPVPIADIIKNPYGRYVSLSTSIKPETKLSSYMRTDKLLGVKSIQYSTTYSGDTTSTDPGIVWYWVVRGETPTVTPATCRIDVQITYYVELFDRKQLT